jgi:hypothetical protein
MQTNIDFYDIILKVYKQSKRDELVGIFENPDPDHNSKLYFCGFLLNVLKVAPEHLINITCEQSAWEKKDISRHYNQIQGVLRSINYKKRKECFINSFTEGSERSERETTCSQGVSHVSNEYNPISCIIGSTHITCYYKKCNMCNLKNIKE